MSEIDQLKQEVDALRKQVAYIYSQGPALHALLMCVFESLPELLAGVNHTSPAEEQSALTHKLVDMLKQQQSVAEHALTMQRKPVPPASV